MPFTKAQLEERRGYLGASESSAALGTSPFFSPVELYLSKIGEGEPIEETIPMMVGTALEPVTLALFERETHLAVTSRQAVFQDPKTPWRRCTVDGLSPDGWIVEAKTSGDYRGWGDGEDDIPLHYLHNAAHSLSCIPTAPGVYFPVLIGGRTFRTYSVARDQELIDLVREGEDAFMQRVKRREPPEPQDRQDVLRLHPKDNGRSIEAPADVVALVNEHAKAKARAKAIQDEIEFLAKGITAFMGDAATLRRVSLIGAQGSVLATWNSQERRTIDADRLRAEFPDIAQAVTKVSSSRVFLNKVKG
jgi:putative phage-type endonuclease